jgi:hypothetical protein
MNEIEDLINRFQHMTYPGEADPPNTAMAILTQAEITVILNALAALKATSQVVSFAPES